MPTLNLEHIACNVPDPEAMAAWYVEHLGMRVVRHVPVPTQIHFLADAAGRADQCVPASDLPRILPVHARGLDEVGAHGGERAIAVAGERAQEHHRHSAEGARVRT